MSHEEIRNLIEMEYLQEIVTSIECSDLLAKDVHWEGGEKNAEGDASAGNEHQSWAIVGDPVVEEIGEPKEHKVLECCCRNECFHRD